MVVRDAAGPAARGQRGAHVGSGAGIGADRRPDVGGRPVVDRRRRPQGPLLARPDGPRPALRQAGQEPVHGHDAGAGLRRRGRRRRHDRDQPAARAELRRAPGRGEGGRARRQASRRPGRSSSTSGRIVAVQSRVQGYVEKLLVRATYDSVRAGQPLAELYVPEWLAGAGRVAGAEGQRAAGRRGAGRRGAGTAGAARHARRRNRAGRARRPAVGAGDDHRAAGGRGVGNRRPRRHGGDAGNDAVPPGRASARSGSSPRCRRRRPGLCVPARRSRRRSRRSPGGCSRAPSPRCCPRSTPRRGRCARGSCSPIPTSR